MGDFGFRQNKPSSLTSRISINPPIQQSPSDSLGAEIISKRYDTIRHCTMRRTGTSPVASILEELNVVSRSSQYDHGSEEHCRRLAIKCSHLKTSACPSKPVNHASSTPFVWHIPSVTQQSPSKTNPPFGNESK